MTYLITAKNLFSASILISSIKEDYTTNSEYKYIIHTPLFIEVDYRFIDYGGVRKLLKEHVTKLIRKHKLKNSTKYTTMEL